MVDKLTEDKKHNLKIYSLYRSVSLDFLFYYVIELLFLTQVKGISESAVALSYTYYAIFKILMQMPVNYLIKIIGNKKSIIIGNCLNIIFIILISQCNNAYILILTSFITATGFSFKEVADLSLLKLSVPKSKVPGEIYARAEAKGYKNYYLLNAITSMLAGSLFIINPYLPLISAIFFIIIAIFIALAFNDIKIDTCEEKKLNTKHYLKELKKQNSFIIKSPRLKCIFIYIGIMSGVFNLMNTYRTSLLVDSNLKNQYITIVIALVGMTCSIGSKIQEKYAKKFKNKSMAIIVTYVSLGIIMLGLIGKNISTDLLKIGLMCTIFVAIGVFQGIYSVITSKYLSYFVDENVLPQILTIKEIYRYSLVAGINLIGALLLKYFSITSSFIYIGCIMFGIGIFLILYMKNKIGLKPEEYTKKDIYNLDSINYID